MTSYSSSTNVPWRKYRDAIERVELDDNVTTIGSNAFRYCPALISVSFPSGLTFIGEYAFYDCAALRDLPPVNGSIDSYAFSGCTGLTQVTFDHVERIYDYAFRGCTNLSSVSFSEEISNVGEYAFRNCPNLKTISAPCTVSSVIEGKLPPDCVYTWTHPSRHVITVAEVPAGCETEGTTQWSYCSNCDFLIVPPTTIDPTGHKEISVTYKAVAEQDGQIVHICEVCGKTLREAEIIPHPVISLSQTSFGYDGAEHRPEVTITDGQGNSLDPELYTVTCPEESTDRGAYSIEVTFHGEQYEGSTSVTYYIGEQKISAESKTVKAGSSSFSLKAKLISGNGKLTYSSSNTKVAKVSSKGTITPGKVGSATITIRAAGTSEYAATSKKITITVVPKGVSSVSLKSSETGKMKVSWKRNTTVSGYQIRYSAASDMSGAKTKTVSKNSTTSATIGSLSKGKTYYVQVRTYQKVGSKNYYSAWSSTKSVRVLYIHLDEKAITLGREASSRLKLIDAPGKVTWSSSNPKIASVSSTGRVTWKGVGTATIYAKCAGVTYKCKVTCLKLFTDSKPHLTMRMVSPSLGRVCYCVGVSVTNWGNESVTIHNYGTFAITEDANTHGGVFWSQYHVYRDDLFGQAAVNELTGEKITIEPGQTKMIYLAVRDVYSSTVMTKTSQLCGHFFYKDASYFFSIGRDGKGYYMGL